MKSFQKRIKMLFLIDMLLIVCAIFLGYLSTIVSMSTSVKFLSPLASGFAFMGVFDGIVKGKLLFDKEEMKKAFIKYSDERNRLIRSKALSLGLNFCFYSFAFLPLFFTDDKYNTIIYTLFVIGISSAFLQLMVRKYYKKKYSA